MKFIFLFSAILFGILPRLKADVLKCRFEIVSDHFEYYFFEKEMNENGEAYINYPPINSPTYKNIGIAVSASKNLIDLMVLHFPDSRVHVTSSDDLVDNGKHLTSPTHQKYLSAYINDLFFSLRCSIAPKINKN